MNDKIATVRGVSLATLIPICITLTTAGLILISIGIVAPAWGTIDVNEHSQVCMSNITLYKVYCSQNWQFGLWSYCVRGGMYFHYGTQWHCKLLSSFGWTDPAQPVDNVPTFNESNHNERPGVVDLNTFE
jgi:hypothetical protein